MTSMTSKTSQSNQIRCIVSIYAASNESAHVRKIFVFFYCCLIVVAVNVERLRVLFVCNFSKCVDSCIVVLENGTKKCKLTLPISETTMHETAHW